jgi:hypothetical protein
MQHLHQWILAAAVMTQAGTTKAQTVNWVEMGSPPARSSMGMAYDWATKSTLLFGGGGTGVVYGDTWIWRGGWSRLSPATSPSARAGAGMVYDGAAGNIVLFGGDDSTGTDLNDTWTWDGATWTQQFPPVSHTIRRLGRSSYLAAATAAPRFFSATRGRGTGSRRLGPCKTPPPVPPRVGPPWRMTRPRRLSCYSGAAPAAAPLSSPTPGIGMELPGPNSSRPLPRPHGQTPT